MFCLLYNERNHDEIEVNVNVRSFWVIIDSSKHFEDGKNEVINEINWEEREEERSEGVRIRKDEIDVYSINS